MGFYKVTVKGGHCGAGKYNPLTFAIAAKNADEAGVMSMKIPGVKHTGFPLACISIAEDEYKELRGTSAYKRLDAQINE